MGASPVHLLECLFDRDLAARELVEYALVRRGHVEGFVELGADRVLDYAKEDFTREVKRYDVILVGQ